MQRSIIRSFDKIRAKIYVEGVKMILKGKKGLIVGVANNRSLLMV